MFKMNNWIVGTYRIKEYNGMFYLHLDVEIVLIFKCQMNKFDCL